MEYGLKPLGRERLWLWAMLTPTLIGLVFGALGSILATLGLSFTHWDLLRPPTWAGLSNYQALFNNPAFLKALTGELPTEYIKEPPLLKSTAQTPKPDKA